MQQFRLLPAQLGHQRIAQVANQLPSQRRRTVSGIHKQVQLLHQLGALPGGNSLKQAFKDGVGHRAHQLTDLHGREHGPSRLNGCGSDRLVHDRQRVAHRSVTGLGQQRQRGVLRLHLLLPRNHPQLSENVIELDRMKAEMLAARADGLRNVLRLRRRHHENDMRRRLFKGLEQCVEGCLGNLVRFIEDVDLVAVAGRGIARGVAQFANLVDAAVGGRVDLDHIHRVALPHLDARIAHSARLRVGPRFCPDLSPAVQRHGHNAGNGGLAYAAMPAEDIPVRNAVLGQRIHQGPRHVVLARHVGKALRTVLPRQNLISHASSAPEAGRIPVA